MIFFKDPAEKERKKGGREEGERKGKEREGRKWKEGRREKQVILWCYSKYPREISGTPQEFLDHIFKNHFSTGIAPAPR